MITLYQFPTGFALPASASQYCTKLEVYFRLTGREYTVKLGDRRKSPTGKMPYVRWPDGRITADSDVIIAELEQKGPALDEDLSAADRRTAEVLKTIAEGPLYFACLYSRFVDPNGWKFQEQVIKDMSSGLVAGVVTPVIRRTQIKKCARNGFATREDYAKSIDAINRVTDTLGENAFMLGDEIQIVDCTVWANLMHIACSLADNPARYAVRNEPLLLSYIDRVAAMVEWRLPRRHCLPHNDGERHVFLPQPDCRF